MANYGYYMLGYSPPNYGHDAEIDLYEKEPLWDGHIGVGNLLEPIFDAISSQTGDYFSSTDEYGRPDRVVKGFDNRLGLRIALPYVGDFQVTREIGPGRFLDKLGPGKYPYSHPPKSISTTFSGYIPMEKLVISYSRSGGPGGQNVNKVNTKVDLRFHLNEAQWLPDQLKEKVREKFKTSINSEGFFIVRSDRTRSQQLNLADALDKLRTMIHTASYEPPPHAVEDVERHRRRHEAAVRERLRQKKHRSLIKQDRQAPEAVM